MPRVNYHHSKETIEKIRLSQKGIKRKPLSKEHKLKISRATKGRKITEEHKERLRIFHSGKVVTQDTKNKLRLINIGKKLSEETKLKIGIGNMGKNVGSNNGSWKGGVNPINKKIRGSREMKIWRQSVFKRDNYTCVWCGNRGGKLNADHIKPFAHYPELRFAKDNGRTLCVSCHITTDTYGKN